MTPADRLRALIAASGLSVTRYAAERLGVHQRTLRRYLSGRWEIPATKMAWIEAQEMKQERP